MSKRGNFTGYLLLHKSIQTMAGRRLRKVVDELVSNKLPGEPAPRVVVAGLSNVYSHYIATFEEYQKQRYEVYIK